MDDITVIEEAKKLGKYLLYTNVIFISFILLSYTLSKGEYAIYFSIFFFIELIIVVFLYMPTLFYYLIKGNTLKISSSKAMLAFGDFYSYITQW